MCDYKFNEKSVYKKVLGDIVLGVNCKENSDIEIEVRFSSKQINIKMSQKKSFANDFLRRYASISHMITEKTITDGIDPKEKCKSNIDEWSYMDGFEQCISDFTLNKCSYHASMNSILFLYYKKPKAVVYLTKDAFDKVSLGDFRPLETLVFYAYVSLNNKKYHVLHSACVKTTNNRCCLFVGDSGTGKSTVCKKLKENYNILSDELSILRLNDGELQSCGSPWSTESTLNLRNNTLEWHTVNCIYFLIKNTPFFVENMDFTDSVFKLLNQLYPYAYAYISSVEHFAFDYAFAKSAVQCSNCKYLGSMLDTNLEILFKK